MYKTLEDFGIEEGKEHRITFEEVVYNSDRRSGVFKTITGVILNYDTWQFSIKAKDGHYIILRKNIIQMYPLPEKLITINDSGINIRNLDTAIGSNTGEFLGNTVLTH